MKADFLGFREVLGDGIAAKTRSPSSLLLCITAEYGRNRALIFPVEDVTRSWGDAGLWPRTRTWSRGHLPMGGTLGASVQIPRLGATTRPHRRTGRLPGQGLQGFQSLRRHRQALPLYRRDILSAPSWAWREHANASGREACVPVLPERSSGQGKARGASRRSLGRHHGHEPLI